MVVVGGDAVAQETRQELGAAGDAEVAVDSHDVLVHSRTTHAQFEGGLAFGVAFEQTLKRLPMARREGRRRRLVEPGQLATEQGSQ
jgi:hypothetical protein